MFIPAKQFAMRNLPAGFQEYEHFQKFKIYANLTVRLRVSYTTPDRADDDPFSDLRGSGDVRTGSGIVTGIYAGEGDCPCSECAEDSPTSRLRSCYWFVYIRTVNHVVYNTREAVDTQVDLFYDDDSSDLDGRMRSFWAHDVVTTDPRDDFCTMRFVIHDQSLAAELGDYTAALGSRSKFQPLWVNVSWSKYFVMIISLPHGMPKQVTLGELKWVTTRNSEVLNIPSTFGDYSCEYDTPTCPGSSGAPVVNLRLKEKEPQRAMMEVNGFVHSGSVERFGVNVNYSSVSSSYTTITPGGIEPSKAPYRIVRMVKTENYDSCHVENSDDSPVYVPY